MEKSKLINNIKLLLLKVTELSLFVLIFFGAVTILLLQLLFNSALFFIFDIYLFLGHMLIVTRILKKSWEECFRAREIWLKHVLLPTLDIPGLSIRDRINWLKYSYLPLLAVESIVILYHHKVTFVFMKELLKGQIN